LIAKVQLKEFLLLEFSIPQVSSLYYRNLFRERVKGLLVLDTEVEHIHLLVLHQRCQNHSVSKLADYQHCSLNYIMNYYSFHHLAIEMELSQEDSIHIGDHTKLYLCFNNLHFVLESQRS
jgi:hypothetical protein